MLFYLLKFVVAPLAIAVILLAVSEVFRPAPKSLPSRPQRRRTTSGLIPRQA
jgi:hypothetical protein